MDYRPIAKRTRLQEDADLLNKWRKMKEEERARKENVGLKTEGNYYASFQKGSNRDCENNGGQNSNHSMVAIKNFVESVGDDAEGSGSRRSNSDSDDDLRVLEDHDDTSSHSVVQLSSDSESATGNDDHGDDGNGVVSSSHVVKQEPEIEIIKEIRPQQQQEKSSEDFDDRSTDEDVDESASSSCNEDDEDFEADGLSDHSTSEDSSGSGYSNSEEEEKEDSDRARVRSTAVPPGRKRRGRPLGNCRGLKRTLQGLKMVMDNDNIPGPVAPSQEDRISRRTRTRSNSWSQSSLPKETLNAFGTYTQPLCVDEEEEEAEAATAAEKMGDRSTRSSYESQKRIRRSGKNESEGRPTKRRRLGASRNLGVHDILVNSILEKGEEVLEKMADVSPPRATGSPLPLKFTYRAESSDDNETERSEIDQELDGLWKELEFALTSCDIGSEFEMESRMIHSEDSPGSTCRSEQNGDPCSTGEHYLILDDEVGLKCKFCSHVSLEIQHVLPDFNKNPFGASQGRDYNHYRMPPGSTCGQMFADLSSATHEDIRARTYQPTDTVWDIIPNIKDGMYPHQREGFEFLWRNIAGGVRLDQLRKSPSKYGNGGCIISHAPGTGKTRLAIAFLQAYMKFYQNSRPVVVAPRSMLMTWEEEFRRWNVGVPFHSLNNDELTGREDPKALRLLSMTGRQEPRNVRLAKFYSWKNHESILGISYRLFEQLVNSAEEDYLVKKKKEEKSCAVEVWKDLLKLPGLLILDEGHTPRNDNSLLFKAFLNVETERRIILSGTPFQNNFGELFNTLCLVRPEFVDSFLSRSLHKKRGKKRLSRSKLAFLSAVGGDENGKDRIDDLRAKIKPFVHVHKGNILQKALLGLRDSVVHLQPSPVQKNLMRKIWGQKNVLKFDNQVALISVHPSLLDDASFISKAEQQRLRSNINAGVKSRFVMELIRLSLALEERVLIFSQYIPPLLFLLEQLRSHFDWNEGRELLYMDGKLELKNRQSSIASFNDPNSEAKVLLASTKACCEGISLVGASRVVLLDVVWNPSVERQAISRAYRLGQKKVVHVYHLIMSGTNEEEKYERQVMKHRLSELVFRSVDKGSRQQLEISSQVCEDKILDEMVHHENLKSMFDKIYQPKADGLVESFGLDNL